MTFEDLPHPRALIKRVSFRVMFKEAGQQERSSMQSFLSSIVRVILRECAISSQFKVGAMISYHGLPLCSPKSFAETPHTNPGGVQTDKCSGSEGGRRSQ